MNWRNILMLALVAMYSTSCGRNVTGKITSPADGTTFTLGSFQTIDVQLDQNEYQDRVIEFRSSVPQEFLSCQNATNAPGRCTSFFVAGANGQPTQNFNQNLRNACKSPACMLVIVVRDTSRDNEIVDVRSVFVLQPDPFAQQNSSN